MSATQQAHRSAGSLPDEVDSPRTKLVYLYLSLCEGGSLSELQTRLEMPKITLLSVLGSLRSAGHVHREDGRYVTT